MFRECPHLSGMGSQERVSPTHGEFGSCQQSRWNRRAPGREGRVEQRRAQGLSPEACLYLEFRSKGSGRSGRGAQGLGEENAEGVQRRGC